MAMEYIPGNSLLHRMDPRTKFFIFLCLIILTVVIYDPFIIGTMLIIIFIAYKTSGIPKDKLMAVLKPSSPAFVLFMLLNYLAIPPVPGEYVYFYLIPFGPWGPVTLRSTLVGISAALRFMFFIVTTRLITLVTAISDLLVALVRMRLPVEAAVSLGIAFASVPLMINQFRTVIEAQKSRGAKFGTRNPITKMRAYVPIIVPSIYLTVLRGIDISRTIESKAFTYNPAKRTFKKVLVLRRIDFAGVIIALVITGFLVYLKFFFLWFDYPFTLDILRFNVIPWLIQAIADLFNWLSGLIFG